MSERPFVDGDYPNDEELPPDLEEEILRVVAVTKNRKARELLTRERAYAIRRGIEERQDWKSLFGGDDIELH